ncbi:phosphatidylinositol mannoside acyltransferase [Rarobacter faecitabidus]|uniref:KDO2-lipid IV(A) lauroyltransferase n=1 Tax=Rarobacter faecitabidus TaxID=13243 RepID=A0A542ZV45_RARFA|nr:phosphatidylinositol mannoside acyltransferase [Rarobacter faecitabidus]TQL64234.1 KDO2-lipid IV(A) lauroyltransferase [Rarobacter faecitabidus]
MSGSPVARAFHLAWRVIPRLPRGLVARTADIAADVTWLLGGKGVRQLEKNLARVTGGTDRRSLRRLSRRGMRSYFRYFSEAFQVTGFSAEEIAARVRAENLDVPRALLAQGKALVLALGHLGNWDLAGLWSVHHFAKVTTVAERLEPPELFEEFVSFRSRLGMEIFAFGDDGLFRDLQQAARGDAKIIPLLADRDLGKSGVEVTIAGQAARVAAGPAALAVSTGAELFALRIYYERLTGERRRRARSRWGIVLSFSDQIMVDDVAGPTRERVRVVSQRWVDALFAGVAEHPEDWHMLQKVFVADLDPEKYRRITGEGSRS